MFKNISALMRIIMMLIILSISFSVNASQYRPVSKIRGGYCQSLVVTESGTVWGCGRASNENSVLGIGKSPAGSRWFTQSPNLENIIDADLGSGTMVVLDANGFVWTCGFDNYGSLGDGAPIQAKSTPVKVIGIDSNMPYLCNIKAVATHCSINADFCLAVDQNGVTYGWGSNSKSQLGEPYTQQYFTSPILISGLPVIDMVAATQDSSHVLDVNGFVWSFGSNYGGKLGIGSSDYYLNRATPQRVVGIGGQEYLSDITSIACGLDHCLALEKFSLLDPNARGRVYAWGKNSSDGVLGDGTAIDRITPVFVKAGQQNPQNPNSPLEGIIAVSAGEGHCMALTYDGKVLCWGNNESTKGQLGSGTLVPSSMPVKVVGFGGKGFLEHIVAISAGYDHCLALDRDGVVWAWGEEFHGTLGTGTLVWCNPIPQPVPFYTTESNDIRILRTGSHYTTIQNAISAASADDTIVLAKRVYDEAVNITKAVALKSEYPDDSFTVTHTIISGGTASSGRGVNIANISGFTLEGLNITNQYYGVYSSNANGTIEKCMPAGNYGVYAIQNSNITMQDCWELGCPSDYSVYANASTMSLANCVISQPIGYGTSIGGTNSAHLNIDNCVIKDNNRSKGICLTSNSSATVNNCELVNNGDAVVAETGSSAQVNNCVIHQNATNAVRVSNASANINDCLIEKNKGNGIYLTGTGTSIIKNNWIVNNGDSSSEYGVYLASATTSPTLINNTISKNYAGGIYRTGGVDPNIINCIVWGNDTTPNKNLDAPAGTFFDHVSYSCIGGGHSGAYNKDCDPCFAGADANNFHILPASYCKNSGDPNRSYAGQYDIDGEDRVIDTVDIGADEVYHSNVDFNTDSIINFVDYAMLVNHWGQSSTDANFSSTYDLVANNVIDYGDMMYFCDWWLWHGAWLDAGSEYVGTYAMLPPPEPNEPNAPAQLQTALHLACENLVPDPDSDVILYVQSDVSLLSMGVGFVIDGNATVTGAIGAADCDQFGWDPSWCSDPDIDPNGTWAYISDANLSGSGTGDVGYFTIHYNSGPVTITVIDNSSADVNSQPVAFDSNSITLGSEEQQMMMPGGGEMVMESGMRSESMESEPMESVEFFDAQGAIEWLEQIWLDDAALRSSMTEAEFNEFIDAIRNSQ